MAGEMFEGPSGSYLKGEWVAIGGGQTWLLIEADPRENFISDLWRQFRTGQEVALEVDVIEQRIQGRSSSFGLVGRSSSEFVVVLGGGASADVVANGTTTRLQCPEFVKDVRYRLAAAPTSIRLWRGTSTGPEQPDVAVASGLPLSAGVVQADEILLEWSEQTAETPPSLVAETDLTQPETTNEGPPSTHTELPDFERANENEAASDVAEQTISATRTFADVDVYAEDVSTGDLIDAPTAGASAVVSETSDGDDGVGFTEDGLATGVPPGGESEDPDSAVVPISTAQDEYHDLFGLTVHRIVEDAAVRPGESEQVAPIIPAPGDVSLTFPASGIEQPMESPAPINPIPPPANSGKPPTTLIDAVPWATSAAVDKRPHEATAQEIAQDDSDLQDLTLNRAAHDALLRQLSAPGSLIQPGPTVHAIMCPAGHPNPAHAGLCRVCGNSVADQTPVTVPRPILGVLRLSTGDVINLDRGVVVGRSPATDRLVGGERPHIVKFASPSQDISRTHIEISLDGWHVLVTDLKSTNGTMVTRPGQEPERLRPDEATLIEPGTVVSLADDASFTFEAIE